MRILSQYISTIILLILTLIGSAIIYDIQIRSIHVMDRAIDAQNHYFNIVFIACINNTSYYYNSGDQISLTNPVYVLESNDSWILSYTIDCGSIFKIDGCNNIIVLNTTLGEVIIKT